MAIQVSKRILLLLILLSSVSHAVEEEQPSLELLEYLGNWEDANGKWIDPQLLEPAVMKVAEREDEKVDRQSDE